MSCAAGVACAEVMKDGSVLANVQERFVSSLLLGSTTLNFVCRSKELFSTLRELQADAEVGKHILDVRGQGLMVAVEFASPNASKYDPVASPSSPKSLASRVAKRCIEKGMYILTTSIYETIRFIPPLIISKEDMAKGTQIFTESVKEVVREG